MKSIILSTATRLLLPLLLVFSIFLLVRGHNEPGGGFVGGLVAAAALALYMIATDVNRVKRIFGIEPRTVIGIGLLTCLASGLIALIRGLPFMTGQWLNTPLPVIGKVGTPLLFDTGIYLVVLGVTMTIILSLAEA